MKDSSIGEKHSIRKSIITSSELAGRTIRSNQQMCRRQWDESSAIADSSCENEAPSTPPATAPAPTSRRKWLEQSIVRRTAAHVRNHVECAIESTPFLQQEATTAPVMLHRSEVRINTSQPPLGSGGFSDVYSVDQIVLDEAISLRCTPVQQEQRRRLVLEMENGRAQYAIKQLRPKLLQSPKDFQQAACDIVMESQYLQRLQDNANVIRLCALPIDGIDAWSTGANIDGYFLLLERVDCTLADRIQSWKRKELPLPKQTSQLEYVLQIAQAIRFLHRHGILFRDLKPENIAFSRSGRVVLLDFGLCRQIPLNKESMDGLYEMSGVGTRRYMAPEVIRNGRYNQQADVYSLTMITWEILTGCRPYLRYGLEEHRQAVCVGHERPRLLPSWSQWLAGFLQHGWHADPETRWDIDTVISKLRAHLKVREPLSPVSVALPFKTNVDQWDPRLLLPRSRLQRADGNDAIRSLLFNDVNGFPGAIPSPQANIRATS